MTTKKVTILWGFRRNLSLLDQRGGLNFIVDFDNFRWLTDIDPLQKLWNDSLKIFDSLRVSASLCESLRVSASLCSLCESLRRRYRIISKTIVVQNEKNGRTLNPFITDNLAICTTTRAPTMHRIFFAEQLLFDPPFTLLDEFIGLKLDRIC